MASGRGSPASGPGVNVGGTPGRGAVGKDWLLQTGATLMRSPDGAMCPTLQHARTHSGRASHSQGHQGCCEFPPQPHTYWSQPSMVFPEWSIFLRFSKWWFSVIWKEVCPLIPQAGQVTLNTGRWDKCWVFFLNSQPQSKELVPAYPSIHSFIHCSLHLSLPPSSLLSLPLNYQYESIVFKNIFSALQSPTVIILSESNLDPSWPVGSMSCSGLSDMELPIFDDFVHSRMSRDHPVPSCPAAEAQMDHSHLVSLSVRWCLKTRVWALRAEKGCSLPPAGHSRPFPGTEKGNIMSSCCYFQANLR